MTMHIFDMPENTPRKWLIIDGLTKGIFSLAFMGFFVYASTYSEIENIWYSAMYIIIGTSVIGFCGFLIGWYTSLIMLKLVKYAPNTIDDLYYMENDSGSTIIEINAIIHIIPGNSIYSQDNTSGHTLA